MAVEALLAVEWSSAPVVIGVVVSLVVIAGAFVGAWRYVAGWLSPDQPPVALGHPDSQPNTYKTASFGPAKKLFEGVRPTYYIEYKSGDFIRNTKTGVRSYDGSEEYTFREFHAGVIDREDSPVTVKADTSIPDQMLEPAPTRPDQDGCLYWARFTDHRGNDWEVVYDPRTTNNTPPPRQAPTLLATTRLVQSRRGGLALAGLSGLCNNSPPLHYATPLQLLARARRGGVIRARPATPGREGGRGVWTGGRERCPCSPG